MLTFIKVFALAVAVVVLPGCGGGASPAKGGTPGKLTFGSAVSSDIKITIHRSAAGGFEELGFANTAVDGSFVLYNSGATEPLWLESGDYAFTLESIGPPVEFPDEFTKPDSTPLKVTWTSDMTSISLDAPPELLAE
jgi:hypothetical protein